MFKTSVFVLISTLVFSACSAVSSNVEKCDGISTFSRIVMDARQNYVEKAFVIDKVMERKQEPSKTELELVIVERAYEMPIMDTPTEKADMSRDFSKIIETMCKQNNTVVPSTIV